MRLIHYPDSVCPRLLEILTSVMERDEYSNFVLGGGTSLSLRFGHRSSVDLDFFSEGTFDTDSLQSLLGEEYPNSTIVNRTAGSLCIVIEGNKVDFLHHPFPLLGPVDTDNGIRFLSLADISAMKINAVTNRGSKKDFFDIYLLHTIGVPLSQGLENFKLKYNGNTLLALRSLVWFNDAEEEPNPMVLNNWSWEMVKEQVARLTDEIIMQ